MKKINLFFYTNLLKKLDLVLYPIGVIVFITIACLPISTWGRNSELGATAEILWDKWGVPHIDAETNEDLFYAFGYAQMHNHANRLLSIYGISRGKACEYWGDSFYNFDYWTHIMEIPEKTQSTYEAQSDEMKTYLDAFAAGINHFAEENPQWILPEYQIVLPISPQDVMGHTLFILYSFLADPYYVFYDAWDLLDESASKVRQREITNGSNAWAIAPSHTQNHHALLLANPHLQWPETSYTGDFSTFFEAHLLSPDLNVYGVAILGMPLLNIVFNQTLGWTHTVNDADYHDFYEITFQPYDQDWGYLWDGGVKPFDILQTSFKILQEDGSYYSEEPILYKTIHGPVIASNGEKGVAVKVADLERTQIYDQYWNMCKATNFSEFENQMRKMQLPYFNTLYSDNQGHIYYFYGALTPKRPEGDYDWQGLIPGNSSQTLWTDYLSYDETPKLQDPQTGWLQNTNDSPWYCTYPTELNSSDYPSYLKGGNLLIRPQRSIQMLLADNQISFEEMIEYKHSTRMLLADRVLDDLIEAVKTSDLPDAKEAALILESWDRTTDNDSIGGIIFENWIYTLNSLSSSSLFSIPWIADDPINTPRGLSNPELAVQVLDSVATEIKKMAGTLSVPWGMINRFHIDDVDLPANGGPSNLGVFRVFHFDSDDPTHQTPYHGDTYIAAVEFSQPVRAKASLIYGNASMSGSPHRTDQLILASNKELRDVLLTRTDIEANVEEKTQFQSSNVNNWELY